MSRRSILYSQVAALFLAAALLSGCGGVGGALTPGLGAGEQPPEQAANGAARFVIKIPRAAKRTSGSRGPRYISPATQSLTIDVTQGGKSVFGFPQTVNLTPTSKGCTSSLASTVCTLELSLAPGKYDATIATYDGTGGAGRALSQAQAVPFTIVADKANTIAFTLGGIPSILVVAPLTPGYLQGGTGGLTVYGPAQQSLVVEALDADGNIITGPGAPSLTVVPSAKHLLTVAGGSSRSPNLFTLQARTSGTPATVTPSRLTLTVTATPAADSGAALVTTIVPLRIAHSALYVSVSRSSGHVPDAVDIFYDGNTAAPNLTVTTGINAPAGVAVDAAGTLYVANFGSNTVTEYPAGSVRPSVTISDGITAPFGVAIDFTGTLYVANSVPGIVGTVTEYPAGGTTPMRTIPKLDEPLGLALDAASTLYVAVFGGPNVSEYPAGSTKPRTVIEMLGMEPVGLAIDAAGTLYVANVFGNDVVAYLAGSTTPSITVSKGIFDPRGVAVDAAGMLYVANVRSNNVTEYPAGSTAVTRPIGKIPASAFSPAGTPQFVAAVPGALSP